MAKRVTPFQANKAAFERARQAAPPITERVIVVSPFSASFDNIDGGDHRRVHDFSIPHDGHVLEPKITCGSVNGDLNLHIEYNGVNQISTKMKAGTVGVSRSKPVKKGDILSLYVDGTGNAKDVLVSFVLRNG